jgi:hypothetical protein
MNGKGTVSSCALLQFGRDFLVTNSFSQKISLATTGRFGTQSQFQLSPTFQSIKDMSGL